MQRICRGVVKDGTIELTEHTDIPDGTPALIRIETNEGETEEDIKKREIEFLKKGFNLGYKSYSQREELHER